MMNPYEAPQTTEPALPPQAPTLEPQLALLQGARRCALGGNLLMGAAIGVALLIGDLIWIQQAKQHGTTNYLNLCGWILLYGSLLLLLVGAIVNSMGYSRFVRYLDHELLVKLYRDCRLLVWIKFVLVITLIVMVGTLEFEKYFLLLTIPVCASLIGMFVYSYFIQARVMRSWGEHFPYSIPVAVRKFYWNSIVFAMMFSLGVAVHAFETQQEPSQFLLLCIMLIFVIPSAAFTSFYKRLGMALGKLKLEEENAATYE